MPPASPAHPSQLALDSLALGGLAPQERAALEAHLATCPRCQERVREAATAREHFERRVLPATLPALRERRRLPALLWGGLPALALGLVLLLVVVRPGPAPEEPDLGIKGGGTLQLFVRRHGRVWQAAPGERLQAGDEVRFRVEPLGRRYVLVVSVDGTGKASVYYPFGGAKSAPIAPQGLSELPGSVVLDAAPGPERLFALFSDAPLETAAVTRTLEALGSRGLGAIRAQERLPVAGVAQASFLFEKGQP